MKKENKNYLATAPLETVMVNIGFVAMTAASIFLLAPHGDVSAHASQAPADKEHGEVAVADHGNGHERMEEIRHDPVSYGTLMRSPSTAGSQ